MIKDQIQRDFETFHNDNPHVFSLLVKFTAAVRATGRKHYSINAVFERIRWHTDIETVHGEHLVDFKLNNNFRSRYVRLLEEEHPYFHGFYHKRQLQAAA